jgi:hypothetical protein
MLLVGLLGAGLLFVALTSGSPPSVSPGAATIDAGVAQGEQPTGPSPALRQRAPATRGHAGVEDRIAGPVLPESRPLSVTIPRLGIDSRLVDLGLDDRGAMEVPEDPASAGWYDPGPTPGALGPAVIAGHVTWNRAPAVFAQLASMRHGDVVSVARADGRRAMFRVTRVARFDKSVFPTRVVFGGIDHAGLRLITCAGDYDESSRRYPDNVVVFARLVSSHPTETRSSRAQNS